MREALRALKEKGLVRVIKNVGAQVRELNLLEADQIYEVREVLEGLIGDKAARAPRAKASRCSVPSSKRWRWQCRGPGRRRATPR